MMWMTGGRWSTRLPYHSLPSSSLCIIVTIISDAARAHSADAHTYSTSRPHLLEDTRMDLPWQPQVTWGNSPTITITNDNNVVITNDNNNVMFHALKRYTYLVHMIDDFCFAFRIVMDVYILSYVDLSGIMWMLGVYHTMDYRGGLCSMERDLDSSIDTVRITHGCYVSDVPASGMVIGIAAESIVC